MHSVVSLKIKNQFMHIDGKFPINKNKWLYMRNSTQKDTKMKTNQRPIYCNLKNLQIARSDDPTNP